MTLERSVACVFAMLVIFSSYSRDLSAKENIQVNLMAVPDPGGPPPFVASEYEPYFKRGTASLTVPFMVKRTDGSFAPCEPGMSDGYLYPSTRYVRWALQKWAFLKRTNFFKPSNSTTAPESLSGFSLPDYLTDETASPTAIREATCDRTYHATFRNLPAGSYIFWGFVDTRLHGSGIEEHQNAMYDPVTGGVDVTTIDQRKNNDTIVDNFFFFSDIVTLSNGEVAYMHQSSIIPFAYQR